MPDWSALIPSSVFTLILLSLVLVLALLMVFSLRKLEYILYAILIWFPLETLVLRYTPPDYYVLVKYLPEVMIYTMLIISWIRYMRRTGKILPRTPVNKFLGLFLLVAGISLLTNLYSPMVWLLGVRQLLRFAIIYFVFLFEEFPDKIIKNFLWIGIGVVVAEACLGIVQYLTGGAFDKYLFFTDTISVGPFQLEGLEEFWAPGQRVFATLGRYDRLGSLLAVGLVMLFPWFYTLKNQLSKERWWTAFVIGGIALVLTSSRASWIAFLAGIFTVGLFLVKDRRLFWIGSFAGAALVLYLLFIVITQSFGNGTVDQPGHQSLRDRLVEAVSPYSWEQSYEGYGRFFFIVNTPLMVVRYYPLFGVGPGNYGGGVAASLLNERVYDRLHLPFGIQNTYGQIDNNWLSIWGETGTLGLLVWILIFREIFRSAYVVQEHSKNQVQRTVAQGLCGVTVAVVVLGFFGPYFEFRTLMVYFWLIVGIALYFFREHAYAWNFLDR